MSEVHAEIQTSLGRISAAMGYAYTHFSPKQLIEWRKLMDPFLDQLVKDCDPNFNIFEANRIMMKKKIIGDSNVS